MPAHHIASCLESSYPKREQGLLFREAAGHRNLVPDKREDRGTQFTCFTSTKVDILTHLRNAGERSGGRDPEDFILDR